MIIEGGSEEGLGLREDTGEDVHVTTQTDTCACCGRPHVHKVVVLQQVVGSEGRAVGAGVHVQHQHAKTQLEGLDDGPGLLLGKKDSHTMGRQ